MLIDNIPYIQINPSCLSSLSACMSMVLSYNGIDIDSYNFDDLYMDAHTEYTLNINHILPGNLYHDVHNVTLSCGLYIARTNFLNIPSDIIETDLTKIAASYLKRKMPVIINGIFPLNGMNVSNTIVIKGFIDNYFIVNDPKGNANSWYKDKHGENMLYRVDKLNEWVKTGNRIYLLRMG